jgi:hypothetical protein
MKLWQEAIQSYGSQLGLRLGSLTQPRSNLFSREYNGARAQAGTSRHGTVMVHILRHD